MYNICLITLKNAWKWSKFTKFFYGLIIFTLSATQWCRVFLNLNHLKICLFYLCPLVVSGYLPRMHSVPYCAFYGYGNAEFHLKVFTVLIWHTVPWALHYWVSSYIAQCHMFIAHFTHYWVLSQSAQWSKIKTPMFWLFRRLFCPLLRSNPIFSPLFFPFYSVSFWSKHSD